MATKEAEGATKRGRRTKSNTNSRNNSRTNSPSQRKTKDDDVWNCNMCKIPFTDPNDKLLECQRCKDHFCINCLDKSIDEYKWMTKSDTMWFCMPCREKVERNILVDREIEEKCNEIAAKFEERIKSLEIGLTKKCGVEEVKEIIREELKNKTTEKASDNNMKEEEVESVITEINERKNRENSVSPRPFLHGACAMPL